MNRMKKLLIGLAVSAIALVSYGQKVITSKDTLKLSVSEVKHSENKVYLDKDSNIFVSVYKINFNEFSTKIKKSKSFPVINANFSMKPLTPSYDTTFNSNDVNINYIPQFTTNIVRWEKLEKQVADTILKYKSNAIIVTGLIYTNVTKNMGDHSPAAYVDKTKIKIADEMFKVLILNENDVRSWIIGNTGVGDFSKAIPYKLVYEDAKEINSQINLLFVK